MAPSGSPNPGTYREGRPAVTLFLCLPHTDLFSCCWRRNCRGAPYSFFAIHILAALVLFMTDGITVRDLVWGGREEGAPWTLTLWQLSCAMSWIQVWGASLDSSLSFDLGVLMGGVCWPVSRGSR